VSLLIALRRRELKPFIRFDSGLSCLSFGSAHAGSMISSRQIKLRARVSLFGRL